MWRNDSGDIVSPIAEGKSVVAFRAREAYSGKMADTADRG